MSRANICAIAASVLSLLGASAAANDVRTVLSHNQIEVGRSFHIEFTTGRQDAQDPDLSPLQREFQILGSNRQSSHSIINGVAKFENKWRVELLPIRTGRLRIPPLQFGAARSNEAFVQVNQAPQNTRKVEDVLVEIAALPQSPYVQQQVEVIVRVWTNKNLRGNLTPVTVDKDAVIKQTGGINSYRKRLQGRDYSVHENRYLVYPQTSGKMTVNPVTLNAQYDQQGRRYTIRKASNAAQIEVRPTPGAFTGVSWLPAEKIELAETWSEDPAALQAGTPITRTIALKGRGVMSSQLPAVEHGAVDHLKVYPEQAELKENLAATAESVRTQKFVLIPSQAGRYDLPPVRVPWWNTRTDRSEYAQLPAKTVTVKEAPKGLVITTEPAIQTPQPAASGGGAKSDAWFWLSALLLLGWIATLGAWWRQKHAAAVTARRQPEKPDSLRRCQKQLEKSCAGGNPHAARDAILKWARLTWPDEKAATLGQLKRSVDDTMLAEEIAKLDKALYSGRGEWSGERLWTALQAVLDSLQKKQPHTEKHRGLAALHKIK